MSSLLQQDGQRALFSTWRRRDAVCSAGYAKNTIMTTRSAGWFLVWAALVAVPAAAQTNIELDPPNPTSADHIILRIPGEFSPDSDVTLIGNHFRIDVTRCDIQCVPVGVDVTLGTLPAGTYTYEIFADGFGVPAASGGFVVAQAGIPDAPTLSPAALGALCLILVGVGCVFIGRQT